MLNHIVIMGRAMRKYGQDNFSFAILEECEEKDLPEREQYWIKKLDTYKNGYNETPGGETAGENSIHRGEEHGMAKLTEEDVIQCRKWYSEGKASHDIWEKYYQDVISYAGFQRMWHGKNWKHVMPEVFNNNPRPKKKFSDEQIQKVKIMYNEEHKTCAEIYHYFNEEISRTTINDICNGRRY